VRTASKPSKKNPESPAQAAASFEKALDRLEAIVEKLDSGNLPLDESLALFREGAKLTKSCREMLAQAEVQVKEALRDVEALGEAGERRNGDDDEDEDEDEDDEDADEDEEAGVDDDELDEELDADPEDEER
jgi:exodeoxyribonuclease VII small subunit